MVEQAAKPMNDAYAALDSSLGLLDSMHGCLNAAITAHASIAVGIKQLASRWAQATVDTCPEFPDCDHDYDSDEIESHAMAAAYYELAQDLLDWIDRGKRCVDCDLPIPDPELPFQEPEKCLRHKDT